jgi:diguanylate cyclase (GGDEF)-like protein
VATAYEHGWVRAVEHLADSDRSLRRLVVGAQLAASGTFAIAALAALPGRSAWQQLLLAAALAWSGFATAGLARAVRTPEHHAMAQLPTALAVGIAGVVGPPGSPVGCVVTLVLIVLTSAPYVARLPAAILLSACAAAGLGVLAAADRAGLPASWLALVAVLALGQALARGLCGHRRLLQDLVRIEVTDPVTGLPNSRYLAQLAAHEHARAGRNRPLAALALEIDGYRDLDNAHGFRVGNDVLAGVAERLRAALEGVGTLAHGEGDTLVALLPAADTSIAFEIANVLRSRAGEHPAGLPWEHGDVPRVRLSVGLAVHPPVDPRQEPAHCGADLLALAMQALRAAEGAGGDCVQVARSAPQEVTRPADV